MTPQAKIRTLKKRVEVLQQSTAFAWKAEAFAEAKVERLRGLFDDFDHMRCELHECRRQLAQIPAMKREIAGLKRKLKKAGVTV
jgi:hypothetical protein